MKNPDSVDQITENLAAVMRDAYAGNPAMVAVDMAPAIAFKGVPSGFVEKAMEDIDSSSPQAKLDGVRVDVSDVRVVLILDHHITQGLQTGLDISAAIAAAYAAVAPKLTSVLASSGLGIPAGILTAFIAALAGIFAAFCFLFSRLIGATDIGGGVYLTVTVPQLVISGALIVSSILVPITAWITMPAAVVACVIVPTSRPKP